MITLKHETQDALLADSGEQDRVETTLAERQAQAFRNSAPRSDEC